MTTIEDGPEVIDLSEMTAPPDMDSGLFDDQDLQVRHPPPKPPSTNFYKLDPRLQSLETKLIIIGVPRPPNGDRLWWDLWGPQKGRQGLMLAPNVSGLMHVPFQQLMSEGPYTIGAFPERVDIKKREVNMGIMVGVGFGPDNSFRYRMLEERWWSSLSAYEDAFLGVFTRTHGWRFIKVRLAQEPQTPFALDPTAFENNFMQWDLTLVAPHPYWYKRKLVSQWVNTVDPGAPPPPSTPWDVITNIIHEIQDTVAAFMPTFGYLVAGKHIGTGTINTINRGTEAAHPLFLVSSPGQAWIQDGPGGAMIECPLLSPKDGYILIDTNPIARTATAATDPVDNLVYKILRNSQLLDFILHDITSSSLPVWRRMSGRFSVPWPAKTMANIKVAHSNANGRIVCLMPQRYGMSFA